MTLNDEAAAYADYYMRQIGGGGYSPYTGELHMRGGGVGDFLSGLYRGVIPIIMKGVKLAAPHALAAASKLVRSVAQDPGDFSGAVRKSSLEALGNITQQMANSFQTGNGYSVHDGVGITGGVTKRGRGRGGLKGRGGKKKSSVSRYYPTHKQQDPRNIF